MMLRRPAAGRERGHPCGRAVAPGRAECSSARNRQYAAGKREHTSIPRAACMDTRGAHSTHNINSIHMAHMAHMALAHTTSSISQVSSIHWLK